jgi:hypothetical protein
MFEVDTVLHRKDVEEMQVVAVVVVVEAVVDSKLEPFDDERCDESDAQSVEVEVHRLGWADVAVVEVVSDEYGDEQEEEEDEPEWKVVVLDE